MKRLLLIFVLVPSICFSQEIININGIDCNLNGTALPGSKTFYLNELKNRYRFPSQEEFDTDIKFNDLIKSADPNQFDQHKAITLTGYVLNVKVGGVESCNCKSKDPIYRDTHIELTPDADHTDPRYRIIVEVTPRIRELMDNKNMDWTTAGLRSSLKGKMVEVSGWLFYDSEHENAAFANDPEDAGGAKNWRASCWEIHPVTNISVLEEAVVRNNIPPINTQTPTVSNTQTSKPGNNLPKAQTNKIETQGNDNFKYILASLVLLVIIILVILISSGPRNK